VAAKGAPEAIAQLCKLGPIDRAELFEWVDVMAGAGLRVLAAAQARWPRGETPVSPEAFQFDWLGLIGLADPVRPEVPAAIRECQAALIWPWPDYVDRVPTRPEWTALFRMLPD
jgi:Ca2+-transporting ATPase